MLFMDIGKTMTMKRVSFLLGNTFESKIEVHVSILTQKQRSPFGSFPQHLMT